MMDACAGSVSGAGGRNSVSLRAESLSRHFERAFTLFADCLLDPAFPEEELERERSLLLQEIAAREDRPTSLAFDALLRARCSRPIPTACRRSASARRWSDSTPSSCVATTAGSTIRRGWCWQSSAT